MENNYLMVGKFISQSSFRLDSDGAFNASLSMTPDERKSPVRHNDFQVDIIKSSNDSFSVTAQVI